MRVIFGVKFFERGEFYLKRKFSFPTAFTILFLILILAAALTYLIPAGSYAKLVYDMKSNTFIERMPDGTEQVLEGSQDTLDKLGVSNDISKFQDGSISKAVAIPGTFKNVVQNPQGMKQFLLAPILGVYDSIGIILFVFVLGGVLGIINESGAIRAGITVLSKVTKGHEYILIIFVTFLMTLGGTTFGLAEETIAFYPILIPVYLAAGYDAIVCVGALYMGSTIGSMFSTTNPFSVVIGSNAAGIHFTSGIIIRVIGLVIGLIITIIYVVRYAEQIRKNSDKSLVSENKEVLTSFNQETETVELTPRRGFILSIFLVSFIVMIYGVTVLGWWFEEMTALFLVVGVLIGVLSGIGEKAFVTKFIAGAADLMGVGLIIGVARSINLILENGTISDSILHSLSNMVDGMNVNVFIILMMLVFMILGLFISSSSGLATMAIPIMAPLADTVGVPRDLIITAFLFGQGLMTFITPNGLILASLELVNVSYNKWLRFIMPLFGMIAVVAVVLLVIAANVIQYLE